MKTSKGCVSSFILSPRQHRLCLKVVVVVVVVVTIMNVCSFEQIILIVIKEEYNVSERNKTFDLTVRFNRGVDKTELHPEHLKVQFLLTGSTQSSSTVSPGQGGPYHWSLRPRNPGDNDCVIHQREKRPHRPVPGLTVQDGEFVKWWLIQSIRSERLVSSHLVSLLSHFSPH